LVCAHPDGDSIDLRDLRRKSKAVAEVKHDPVVLANRAALAAVVLFIHTALIATAIATVYGTEKWIHFLWSDADPLLFDRVPYRFLFQAWIAYS
jgi:hypothetical protein